MANAILLGPAGSSAHELPFFSSRIPAGFPSPAQDHLEGQLSLDELLNIRAPHTYLVRASGDSMTGAGIHDGDLLVVDRALPAHSGAVVIAALAGEKLDLLAPYVTRYAPARARVMTVPLVILALAFWHSWAAGLVLLVSGPLIPLFMALIGMAAKEASARQMAEIGTLNDLLVERLSALVDIRLLGAGGAVMAGFSRQASDLRARTMAVLRVAFLSSTVLELFAAIGVAMVAVYVGFSLLGALSFGAWGGAVSPRAGIFLLLLAPDFYQPLRDLSAAWHDRAAATAVIDEIEAWAADPGPQLPGMGAAAPRLAGPASLALLGCLTPAGMALPDIRIAAGERVALVGASGAGKTSALRLMAGLELPAAGQVIVAGQALTGSRAAKAMICCSAAKATTCWTVAAAMISPAMSAVMSH